MTKGEQEGSQSRESGTIGTIRPQPWGWWTKHKLQILGDYLQAFATASNSLEERIYLDLFAGSPLNVSRETGETILGSVHRALTVHPPFTRICLFELEDKAPQLAAAVEAAYPQRPGIQVYAGDCNVTISQALNDLRRDRVDWAPVFAFVDQFDSEVKWSTMERISRFRRGKTKAEMWILFATSFYPRGLNIHGGEMNAAYGQTVTDMLGSDEWLPIAEARRRGLIDAAMARAEWVNLMRWRLVNVLGYSKSYSFTMKNTSGQDLYDMIFVTDSEPGDRIMRHLYGKAAGEHEAMRRHALALRRDRRKAEQHGVATLFEVPMSMMPEVVDSSKLYIPEPPREPFKLPRSALD